MATLTKLKNAIYKSFQDVTGKSINVDLKTIGGNTDDAEYFQNAGFHSIPHNDVDLIVLDVQGLNIGVASHDYKFNKTLDKGETLIYSYDENGNVLSSVKLNKDGEFIINDGTDYAVKYSELKTGFDKLKDDFNNFLTHVHGASGTPPTPVVIPSTASIDSSKVEEVRL